MLGSVCSQTSTWSHLEKGKFASLFIPTRVEALAALLIGRLLEELEVFGEWVLKAVGREYV